MKNINAIDQYINAMVDLFAKNPISDEQLIQMEIKELLKILYNADANNININDCTLILIDDYNTSTTVFIKERVILIVQ